MNKPHEAKNIVAEGTKCRAYLLNSQPPLVANVDTKVLLDAVTCDILNEFNVSNHKFITKNSGFYFVKALVMTTDSASGAATISIRVNNIMVRQFPFSGSRPVLSDIIYLYKDDYLELYYNCAVVKNISANELHTYMTIFQIG